MIALDGTVNKGKIGANAILRDFPGGGPRGGGERRPAALAVSGRRRRRT